MKRAALFALLLLTACPPAGPPATILRIHGDVRDASVTIDDIYVGALAYVGARGVGVPRGKHRITVEKTGYFPWDQIIESNEDHLIVEVKLTKIPD